MVSGPEGSQPSENSKKKKPPPGGSFILRLARMSPFNNRVTSELPDEQTSEAAQRLRSVETGLGRFFGREILRRVEEGRDFNIFDREGRIVGDYLSDFVGIDPTITYAEMGFADSQIEVLEVELKRFADPNQITRPQL